ncbi:PTS system oligo-beta-mannoside-specific EIIC component [Raoultella planticola]|uniref:PTS system oligo-beta-mannoside-specific EIIC component n=1 Tax=Raoultella planticola TaxID=575 RepID=A0A485C153_RAOPL|nr:PTS system oligo-beta-mannoside-specific EIIC component [Raoultella planticola]
MAIIVALISSEVFCRLARNPKVTITMPAAVPPAVARSFKVLLPIFFVMISFSIINYLLTRISPNGLNDLIYTLIQAPLKDMGTNIITVLILGLVANFLWVLGIHGPNTVAAIRETIFSEANLENLSLCGLTRHHMGGALSDNLDRHQRCVCQLRRLGDDAGSAAGNLHRFAA